MSECIAWPGPKDRDGYGKTTGGLAHRAAWVRANGPIPEGMTVDHVCFQRDCVNVEHLRLLSAQENRSLRQSLLRTHCPNGHPWTPENTYTRPGAIRARACRACNAAAVARYKKRKTA
jgi:hypothetical protein